MRMTSSSKAMPQRKLAVVGGYCQLPVIPTQTGETDCEEGAVRKMSTSRCVSDISPVDQPEPSIDNFGFPVLVPVRKISHSNGAKSDGRLRRISAGKTPPSPEKPSTVYVKKAGSICSTYSFGNGAESNARERKRSTSQRTLMRKTSLSSANSESTFCSMPSKQLSRRSHSRSEAPSELQQNGNLIVLSEGIPRIVLSRRVARNFRQSVHQQIVDSRGRGILTFSDRPHGRESVLESVNIEPTYQMEPVNKFSFYYRRISSMINDRLSRCLNGQSYHCRKSAKQAQILAEFIKEEVKGIGLDRYKIITMVTIGENKGQSLQVSSRAVWDNHNDSFVSSHFQNGSLFCVAKVFAVYCE